MTRIVIATIGAAWLSCGAAFAQDVKLVAEGKKVYAAKECSKCHMIAGKGTKIGSSGLLDGVATKLSEADIRKWLTDPAAMEASLDHKPKVKMSSKKIVLTTPELDAVVAYMLTLKK